MTDEEIAVALAEHKKDIDSLEDRVLEVEELTKAINELALSVKELVVNVNNANDRMEHYEESLKNQGERIGALEKKPVKRLDTIVTALITAIISVVVTCLFTM